MITMAGAITDAFAAANPDHAATYDANADTYLRDLRGLDGESPSAC
jgi:ABC-type Zn uptake system ZnuABC Zn-binding protein ZnuA